MERLKEKVEALTEDVKSLDSSKCWLERRLQETEEEMKESQTQCKKLNAETVEKHNNGISDLKSKHEKEVQVSSLKVPPLHLYFT